MATYIQALNILNDIDDERADEVREFIEYQQELNQELNDRIEELRLALGDIRRIIHDIEGGL